MSEIIKKSIEQTVAEAEVEDFRNDLGPFVVAAEVARLTANPGLPLGTIPGSKLEPGRGQPAFGLAEAERKADQALAARSLLELVVDSRGMSADGWHYSGVSSSRSALAPPAAS